jgi:hypothetical protein
MVNIIVSDMNLKQFILVSICLWYSQHENNDFHYRFLFKIRKLDKDVFNNLLVGICWYINFAVLIYVSWYDVSLIYWVYDNFGGFID